jgi:hypothetical protein
LFLPSKVGNLDCTMCLDCVHACPHDNVALAARLPGLELLETRRRSGIGLLAHRDDIAALAVVFTFGALVNAFAMTAPAIALERRLGAMFHTSSETLVLGLIFLAALFLAPIVLMFGAAIVTRRLAPGGTIPLKRMMGRHALALVPLGLGVWLAHYGFHLLTGILTVVPVTQSAAIDLIGWPALGPPAWRLVGMQPGAVYPIQVGFVLLGACGSFALLQATAERDHPARSTFASIPWLVVDILLASAALWILSQPMEMRGLDGIG